MDLSSPSAPAAARTDALPGIDLLRGLAVLAVCCHHLQAHLRIDLPWIGRVGGLLGVELFFIVSGFLIARSAAGLAPDRYAIRRLCRIFPVYWVVVMVLTVAGPVGDKLVGADQVTWIAFGLNLLALSHAYPPALAGFDVTTVSWSLTVELLWYAIAPLLVLVPGLRPPAAGQPIDPRSRRAVPVFVLASTILSCAWVWLAQRGAFDALFRDGLWAGRVAAVDDFHRYAYIVNAAPAHWVFFALGAGWAALGAPRPHSRLARGLALVAIPATLAWPEALNAALGLNPSPAPAIGLGALFVLLFAWDPASGSGSPARPWPAISTLIGRSLQALGRVSYPLYLVHVPVMLAMARAWPLVDGAGAFAVGARALVVAVASLGLSVLLHRWIEEPGIAFGRHLTSARRSA